jgi:hypothetical protein
MVLKSTVLLLAALVAVLVLPSQVSAEYEMEALLTFGCDGVLQLRPDLLGGAYDLSIMRKMIPGAQMAVKSR